MRLAARVRAISPSPTMAVMAEAMRLRAAGEDVVDFSAGQPDFDTPEVARTAGIRAIESGYTRYTPNPGAPDLRAAVADCYRRDFGLDFAAGNVLITSGGKHALTGLLLATCEGGDEVVIPTPYWPTFPEQVKIAGARPVFAPAAEEAGFRPTRAAIEPAITGSTRAIILNIPGNPSGVVLSPHELEEVAELALEADAWLLWDDTYARLTFEPAPEGAYRRMAEILGRRFLVAGGASKTYAMTGWRLGWAIGPEPVIKGAASLQSQMTSNASSISQKAALAAVRADPADFAWMTREFARRMVRMRDGLLRIEGVRCGAPDGGFYLFPDFAARLRPGEGSGALASALLDAERVATVPGAAFGHDTHLRLSYATSDAQIDEGLSRIRHFFGTRSRSESRRGIEGYRSNGC